jgi:hypothetical protein
MLVNVAPSACTPLALLVGPCSAYLRIRPENIGDLYVSGRRNLIDEFNNKEIVFVVVV